MTTPQPQQPEEGTTAVSKNQVGVPRTAQTFVAAVTGIDHGAVAGKADEQLAELVRAVRETGRKGSVIIRLEVRPSKGNDLNVEVAASVTAKMPEPDAPWGLFFVTEEGALTRDDPRYDRLFDLDDAGRPAE